MPSFSRILLVLAIGVALFAAFLASSASAKLRIAVELLGWKGFFTVARDTAASRVLGSRRTRSREAFHRLLDTLSEADLQYCVPQRRVVTEEEIVECERLISHLISTGFRLFYEADLDRPHFEPIVGPRMKSLGDNPDAFYFNTVFNPSGEFIVKGRVLREVYLSLTIYEAPCVGCFSSKVIVDVNHRNLKLSPKDRSFEIVVSPHPKPKGETRDWLYFGNMTAGSFPQLITRHYYEGEISAQLDPTIRHELSIEPLKSGQGPPARLSDVQSAERMERVRAFVHSHSLGMLQDPAKAPSWFSFTPNKFGPAVLFRNEVEGLGAVDIVYSAGPFKFEDPDRQGLVISGQMPRAAFANIALWNKLLQTFAYETGRTISLNRKQMKRSRLDPTNLTGPFKILLSKRQPKNGLPDDMEWLDSEGREDGTMFWRFLLPEEDVVTPVATLVNIDDVK